MTNQAKSNLKEALKVSLEAHYEIQKKALGFQEKLVEALMDANNICEDYKCFMKDVESEVLDRAGDPLDRLNNIWSLIKARKNY